MSAHSRAFAGYRKEQRIRRSCPSPNSKHWYAISTRCCRSTKPPRLPPYHRCCRRAREAPAGSGTDQTRADVARRASAGRREAAAGDYGAVCGGRGQTARPDRQPEGQSGTQLKPTERSRSDVAVMAVERVYLLPTCNFINFDQLSIWQSKTLQIRPGAVVQESAMNRSLMTFISASGFPAILALKTSVNAQSDVAQRLASRVEAATKTVQDACSADVTKFCGR